MVGGLNSDAEIHYHLLIPILHYSQDLTMSPDRQFFVGGNFKMNGNAASLGEIAGKTIALLEY